MSTPTYCTSCGHELGAGRFCTNCGKPVPGRHPEAAPGASAPASPPPPSGVVPPPVGQLPPSARYPLFADATAPARPAPDAPPPTTTLPPPLVPSAAPMPQRRRTPWLPWVLGVVVLLLIAGIGGFLLLGGDDEPGEEKAGDPGSSASAQPSDDVPPSGEPEQPDASGTDGPVESPDPGDVVDLTGDVTATVPADAPPSRDRANKPVTFDAKNMWDGKPRTSWRMPGDGTGETLTFDLGQDVVITEVGMINGYAKVDGADNWYQANRRVRAVQWEFDDGTRVTQEFADGRTLQRAEIGPIATRTVKVHLLTVTPPGDGPNRRDYTAISEIQFLGAPA